MTGDGLNKLLGVLPKLRIGVIGDFCLDAYWNLDMSVSERSVETGMATRPIRRQTYSLGGAGNVVSNLAAMGVGQVSVFGVVGDDPFGWDMRRLLEKTGADTGGLLVQRESWDTPVYIKPILDKKEDSRLDFGDFNTLAPDMAGKLAERMEKATAGLQALIINQQLQRGIHVSELRQALNTLIARHPKLIVVADCRHIAGTYAPCVNKINACEAARLCGETCEPEQLVPLERSLEHLHTLFRKWRRPVFVTRGARGCIAEDASGHEVIHGLHIVGRTDPVGAGDSMVAGVAAAMAAGRTATEAAEFGNFVAGVTVQKLFQTGTATPDEILAIGASPDYIYRPELADDPRGAQLVAGSDIEVVEPFKVQGRITHAIFDHDGTISTLREGWEQVMEPMMVRAILGPRYESVDEGDYARVVLRVRDYIDKTTGIQTLEQMQGLVGMVREFEFVPGSEIQDAAGYKRIYTDSLLGIVQDRLRRFRGGERDISDYTLKGSVAFLRKLHDAGVKLHLASGTDREDVVREAEALGYADLFEGRIYGAVGDIRKEAKRIVLERILGDIGPANVTRLATFGDGPVEIRETRKRGGLAFGIASDELRRFGMNPAKRRRLICAGAHYIAPDFAQVDTVLGVLGLGRHS